MPGNANLQRRLNEVLDEDLIGATTDLQAARTKIVSRINDVIGETVDITELRKIRNARMPGEPGSMGGIFETWVRKNYRNIGGKNNLLGKKTFKNVKGNANEASDITFDDHYMPNEKTFVGQEFKSGDTPLSAREIQQAKRYRDVIDNPAKYGYEKAYAEYVFLTEDAARKSFLKLEKEFPPQNLKVYFVDDAGELQLIKPN